MGQFARGCYTILILCTALVVFAYITGFLSVNVSALTNLMGL
ncbi:hypothetical protein HNP86_001307 [Methanococcus maripaludis]|uniref:Uncharacterized protein n=1 Tax=Methanococcus maripaludis TaxID=39152 RepID=A0A7J9NZL2_METMI|nr:hypothetical protein [Methanococcus maripaludis]MBA2851176.1 hypothetical protein [Methanococcus maripaludis]